MAEVFSKILLTSKKKLLESVYKRFKISFMESETNGVKNNINPNYFA